MDHEERKQKNRMNGFVSDRNNNVERPYEKQLPVNVHFGHLGYCLKAFRKKITLHFTNQIVCTLRINFFAD